MISIVMPVYNEERNIRNTLEELKVVLKKMTDFEIIVVNDGSTDSTLKVLSEIEDIKTISYPENRGKGFALRKGIMQSRGQIIGFVDSDEEMPSRYISQFYEEIKDGSIDVVVGKKQKFKKSIIMFNNKVKSIYVQNDSLFFDPELMIACMKKSMTIKEIPVEQNSIHKCGRIGLQQAKQMLKNLFRPGRQSCSDLSPEKSVEEGLLF